VVPPPFRLNPIRPRIGCYEPVVPADSMDAKMLIVLIAKLFLQKNTCC